MIILNKFCECYSLRAGLCILAIFDMIVSGGLICDFKFQFPDQISAFRRLFIYASDKLNLLELNVEIAFWIMIADVLFVSIMLIPVSFATVSTPLKTKRSVRIILIPCIVERTLSILHSIAAIIWLPLTFSVKCAEIVGVMLAVGLRILLGAYLVLVAISYYEKLGIAKKPRSVYRREAARDHLLANHNGRDSNEHIVATSDRLDYAMPTKGNLKSDGTDNADVHSQKKMKKSTLEDVDHGKKYVYYDDTKRVPRDRDERYAYPDQKGQRIKKNAEDEKSTHRSKYLEQQEKFLRQAKHSEEDDEAYEEERRRRKKKEEERRKYKHEDEERRRQRYDEEERRGHRHEDYERRDRRYEGDGRRDRRYEDGGRSGHRYEDDETRDRRYEDDGRRDRRYEDDERRDRRYEDDGRRDRRYEDDERRDRRYEDDEQRYRSPGRYMSPPQYEEDDAPEAIDLRSPMSTSPPPYEYHEEDAGLQTVV
eukprot:gene6899-7677_t